MLRILHNTNIDFIGKWRVVALAITAFLLPAMVWVAFTGFTFGIEFTSGTLVQLEFTTAPDVGAVRDAVSSAGINGAEVQTFGSAREIVVRAQEREHVQAQQEGAETVVATIRNALTQRFGANAFRVIRTEAIGPRVGADLRRNAILAVLISFAVSLLYLAWRFDWRMSLAAVIANAHDIIATFAFIKYMNIEITLFVVGGILTVIGYSLNDTVVVFDRLRELLHKGERRSLSETLNRAVNETLPRTVMTGTTVIACLLALIILGGDVLRPFAWVLLFGILVGTLSSIYVAAPILLILERRWPRQDGERKGVTRAVNEERKREKADRTTVTTP